jgi:predicted choloylglycine hydrolase
LDLTFNAIADDASGHAWQGVFQRAWPAYRHWYLQDGALTRPSFLACRRALELHMPEFVPRWSQLVEVAGGGDIAARFLSLWCPPAYDSACSQAVWPGDDPLLVRNYDYSSKLFDALILHTQWGPRRVLGTSDCLIGLVDGINDHGLALSLTFGGRRVVGTGFGVPIVLRYVLETCSTVAEAAAVLARIPTHMSYNITALDAEGELATVHMSPDRPALVTSSPVATNHQPGDEIQDHVYQSATIEREEYLLRRLTVHKESQDKFTAAFLRPPLFSLAYERGRGTLYTAAFRPRQRTLTYLWPHVQWTLGVDDFEPGVRRIHYPMAALEVR